MLVKLVFVMQRLKKYLKNFFVMINKDGGGEFLNFMGGHSYYEGGYRAHWGSPSPPPTKENPDVPYNSPDKICYISPHHQYSNIFVKYK